MKDQSLMSTNEPLSHVNAYIRSLGPDDETRGKQFDPPVSGRTIRRWLNQGRYPDGWRILHRHPALAHEFCKDIPHVSTALEIEIP